MFTTSKTFKCCLLIQFVLVCVLANVEGIDTAAAAQLDSPSRSVGSLGVGPSELGKTRARRVRGVLKGAALGAIAGGAGAAIMKQGK